MERQLTELLLERLDDVHEASFAALVQWAVPLGFEAEHIAGLLFDLGAAGTLSSCYRGGAPHKLTKVFRRQAVVAEVTSELGALEQAERRYLRRRGWTSSTRRVRITRAFAPLPILEEAWAHPKIPGLRPTAEALALQRVLDERARRSSSSR